jgi:nucleotide-binding universal stress UspA family protein
MPRMASRAKSGLRTIVLGTDFAAPAQNALARALHIAKLNDATLHVVHATPRLPRPFARRFRLPSDHKLRESLERVLERIRKAGVPVHAHLMQGNAIKVLTAKARAVAAELVVVGARGRTFPDSMIGSTAERLIAMDQHRVLMVRRTANRSYSEVVIAANEDSRLKEQVAAARLLSSGARYVLHAYEAPFESALLVHGIGAGALRRHRAIGRREAEARMVALVRRAGLEASDLVLRHGSATRVLQRVDHDALLVLSRGASVVRRLLIGSVTRAVVAYGASDLLLV